MNNIPLLFEPLCPDLFIRDYQKNNLSWTFGVISTYFMHMMFCDLIFQQAAL